MREQRGSLYLLTGVILGLVAGLVYAWVIDPVRYTDVAPSAMREDFKAQYRSLIASAYLSNGNLDRAKARLVLLKDPDIVRSLTIQAQSALVEGRPEREARALAMLAVALGQEIIPPTQASTPTVDIATVLPSRTQSPTPLVASTETQTSGGAAPTTTQNLLITPTPLPSRTPTSAPGTLLAVQELTLVCDPALPASLIQIYIQDAAGEPIAGVEVIIRWDGQEDHSYTGLKPELGLGYADFVMTTGVLYDLQVVGAAEMVPDLTPAECEGSAGSRYWGSWKLVFVQP